MKCGFYLKVRDALREPTVDGKENFFRESELRGRVTETIVFRPFSDDEIKAGTENQLAHLHAEMRSSPESAQLKLDLEH